MISSATSPPREPAPSPAPRPPLHQHRLARPLAGVLALGAVLATLWLAWPERETTPPPATAPSSSPSKVRIAVLPLANLTPNEENRYFADGVTEDALTHLARVPDLFVVSSASVLPDTGLKRPVAEIAAMLGVDDILRGNVRPDGERVRITAQLVDAKQNPRFERLAEKVGV